MKDMRDISATMWQTWQDMGDLAHASTTKEEMSGLLRAMDILMKARDIVDEAYRRARKSA